MFLLFDQAKYSYQGYRYLFTTVPAYGLCTTVQTYMATIGMQLVSIAVNILHIQGFKPTMI